VNAFVNAGFGKDLLVTPEGNEWLYKNKDHGMLSAAASLGMIMLWNVEEGLTQIDKFLYSNEVSTLFLTAPTTQRRMSCADERGGKRRTSRAPRLFVDDADHAMTTRVARVARHAQDYIKAGAALAIGIVSSGVRHESDPPIALLPEHLESTSHPIRCAAAVALGIAYAGSGREDVMEVITPRLVSPLSSLERPPKRTTHT
jgi:26S proteasome regulatory subunit N1